MSSIWFDKSITVEKIKSLSGNSMIEHLGLEWTELGDNYIKAKLPVDHRTKQPFGLLHGGASCMLAETLGSYASHLVVDAAIFFCVGLEINANHIRGVKEGFVEGVCSPVHIGTNTHVWDIRIYDEKEKLVCISRLTVAILKKPA